MPRSNSILNLPGFSILKISGIDRIVFELKYTWVLRCAHCKSKRGILALLRTRPDRLTPHQLRKRNAFLAEHPAIACVIDT